MKQYANYYGHEIPVADPVREVTIKLTRAQNRNFLREIHFYIDGVPTDYDDLNDDEKYGLTEYFTSMYKIGR